MDTQENIKKPAVDARSSMALQVVALIWYLFFIFTAVSSIYSYSNEDATVAVSASIVSENGQPENVKSVLHVRGEIIPAASEPKKDVKAGKAYISIEVLGTQRKSIQISTDLDDDGKFKIEPENYTELKDITEQDQIEIHVTGALSTDNGYEALYSEGIAFVNKKQPYSKFFKFAVAVTMILALFSFFTGPYRELDHRVLITFSYILIAASIIAPFWIFYQGSYLLTPLETKAVSIIQVKDYFPHTYLNARTDVDLNTKSDVNMKVAIDQWALNIGGIPTKAMEGETKITSGNFYDVLGGIVVPIFVLILALFGGAVRMAQMIPTLQCGFRHNEQINLMNLLVPFAGKRDAELPSESREDVEDDNANTTRSKIIQQITFLITSPVIAVAAYYMLMGVNSEFAQNMPLVVILAFTSGFMTDKVLKALAQAGSGVLDHSRNRSPKAEVPLASNGEPLIKKKPKKNG